MEIAISIPVHEKPDVIIDQIKNIKKYVSNVIIVLHISKVFYEHYDDADLYNIENVFINPEHLLTEWGNIISAHLSNFLFIKSKTDFDYFVMHSSNDMYIKYGLSDYIKKFDAGFQIRKITQPNTQWWPSNVAYKDKQIKNICLKTGQAMMIASQVEGSFYRTEIMERIVGIILQCYKPEESKVQYTREEFYFSTVASSIIDWEKVGRPTTFSEVHRFDRKLWKSREKMRRLYFLTNFIIPQKFYNKLERIHNDILFKSKFYKITKKDIRCLRKNANKATDENRFLDDGSGSFQLYDEGNIFSVKRVPRDCKNSIRQFIKNLKEGKK